MVDWELIFCPITPGSQITQILTQTARCMYILLLPNGSIWMRCVRESVERLRSNGQFISWAAFLSTVPMLALLWSLHCKCISLHFAYALLSCLQVLKWIISTILMHCSGACTVSAFLSNVHICKWSLSTVHIHCSLTCIASVFSPMCCSAACQVGVLSPVKFLLCTM